MNASVPLPTSGKIPRKLLQGFCIDLIEELSKLANFKYEIYLQQSGYAGMVQELKDKVGIYLFSDKMFPFIFVNNPAFSRV